MNDASADEGERFDTGVREVEEGLWMNVYLEAESAVYETSGEPGLTGGMRRTGRKRTIDRTTSRTSASPSSLSKSATTSVVTFSLPEPAVRAHQSLRTITKNRGKEKGEGRTYEDATTPQTPTGTSTSRSRPSGSPPSVPCPLPLPFPHSRVWQRRRGR